MTNHTQTSSQTQHPPYPYVTGIAADHGVVPLHFIYPASYAQPVPVHLDVVQGEVPRSFSAFPGYPCAVPFIPQIVPQATPNKSVRHQLDNCLPTSPSYTEQWANQLSYWSTPARNTNDRPSNEKPSFLPPISNVQPLAVVKPIGLHVPSSPSHTTIDDTSFHPNTNEDVDQNSVLASTTSVDSCRRSFDGDDRSRICLGQVLHDQIAEKDRRKTIEIERDRNVEIWVAEERKNSEENERIIREEEQMRKAKEEEDREKRERAVLDSIERARKESERLRKAKLYKHVLEDSEKAEELKKNVLGVGDNEKGIIMMELESVERQKKHDLELISKRPPVAPKKSVTSTPVSSVRTRSSSLCENVRPLNRSYNVEELVISGSSPFSRIYAGYRSLRVSTSSENNTSLCRSSSSEKFKTNKREDESSHHRHPSLKCEIPVRPQRRIPPPVPRRPRLLFPDCSPGAPPDSTNHVSSRGVYSRSNSWNPSHLPLLEHSIRLLKTEQIDLEGVTSRLRRSSLGDPPKSLPNHKAQDKTTSFLSAVNGLDTVANINETEGMSTVISISSNVDRSSSCGTIHPNVSRSTKISSSSSSNKSPINAFLPVNGVNKKTSNSTDILGLNPLFEPLKTRTRAARNRLINLRVNDTSGSSSPESPSPSNSAEDHSAVHQTDYPSSDSLHSPRTVGMSIDNVLPNGSNNAQSKKTEVSSGAKHQSVLPSPFKQKLGDVGVVRDLQRDDLTAPEIRRKGDLPNSIRLRSSAASLLSDSDDGSASLEPIISRFNSRTSQYRSFNMKKTSERNQKVLDQLSELRAQLKLKQMQMERHCASHNVAPSKLAHSVLPVSSTKS